MKFPRIGLPKRVLQGALVISATAFVAAAVMAHGDVVPQAVKTEGLEALGEEWLEEVHEALATLLQVAVLLHVAAALLMSRIERVNLVRAMITGIKTWR